MRSFVYTARDASGALKRGGLEAADRGAALAVLKARGLTPVSVTEGNAPRGVALPPWFSVRAAGLAAVALALAAGYFVSRDRSKKTVKPAPAPKEEQAVTREPESIQPEKTAVEVPAPQLPSEPVAVEPPPARPGLPVSERPRPADTPAVREQPKAARVIVPGIRRNTDTNAPNPYATFRTRTERALSQILSAKPGEVIVDVGPGPHFERDFAEALKNKIEIYPTDSEEMAAHKEDVAWAKEELRKMVQEGASPQEVIARFREEHNAVAAFRSDLQRKLLQLKREGKMKEAEAFVKEANDMLAPYKTRPLSVSPTLPVKKNP
jgi:hypothetical protein